MTINTYETALSYLGTKSDRPLPGCATRLQRRPDGRIAVKYQATDVVTYAPDGRIVLQTGGWQSVTTKARINEYTPARIHSNRGIWYFAGGARFVDGAEVLPDGAPVAPILPDLARDKADRAFDRKVSRYITAFAAAVEAGLENPSGGDCWGCYFSVTEPETRQSGFAVQGRATPHGRSEPMGVGHYLEHLADGYVVPSLLWNAIKANGYANPALIWQMVVVRKDGAFAARILRSYFKRLKPALRAE